MSIEKMPNFAAPVHSLIMHIQFVVRHVTKGAYFDGRPLVPPSFAPVRHPSIQPCITASFEPFGFVGQYGVSPNAQV